LARQREAKPRRKSGSAYAFAKANDSGVTRKVESGKRKAEKRKAKAEE
jgi:hypothetical protein